ncbi:putative ribonuclease H-like domain-containing protein [Rosa chinensis]|uniref:Putative ribonuclease H-like domain-containing protein n=1 Tax=Rosa chinensis TaxID=74649 RepID=A0A2P6Q5G2_ROSCH|nr:putative ribonuclease H-like domain-containing protein [Rosa chinensis]
MSIIVIGSRRISATVAKRNKDVDDSIEKFLSNKNYVMGLDIEWSLSRDSEGVTRSKIPILTLCDGDHCLIVQLPHLDSAPTSLCNFLQLPDYTFVVFDIARSMERLEKEYGFGCKNSANLRTMAAKFDDE